MGCLLSNTLFSDPLCSLHPDRVLLGEYTLCIGRDQGECSSLCWCAVGLQEIRSVLASCYRMAVSRSDRELLIHDHLDHIKQSLQAMLVDKYAPVKEVSRAFVLIAIDE